MTSWWRRKLDCPNGGTPRLLQVGEHADRPFDAVGDVPQEAAGGAAVADPVVEGQRELGDLAHRELTLDHPGLVDDPADAEQRGLGVVDDRRGAVDAEDAVVVQGERAAGEISGCERTRRGRDR